MTFPGLIRTMIAAAALGATMVGTANSTPIAVNGGSSWDGWTLQGRSDALGIYGKGSITNPYYVYTTVFNYNGETASGSPTGGGGGLTGFGGFNLGNLVLGVGISMIGGELVAGSRTLRIDLGNNSYIPDPDGFGVGSAGKTSSTSFANDGDFNIQNSAGFVANQLVVFTPEVNISAESGNPVGATRPFASFRQTTTYQIFVNLSGIEAWRTLSSGAGYGAGSDQIAPLGGTLTFALNGYSDNNVVISNLPLTTAPSAVPSPGSLALIALSLVGLAAARRRRLV